MLRKNVQNDVFDHPLAHGFSRAGKLREFAIVGADHEIGAEGRAALESAAVEAGISAYVSGAVEEDKGE